MPECVRDDTGCYQDEVLQERGVAGADRHPSAVCIYSSMSNGPGVAEPEAEEASNKRLPGVMG